MKKVLLLGAGLVTRPMVNYLLKHGLHVTIATRTVSKADTLVSKCEGQRNYATKPLDAVNDEAGLAKEIEQTDLVFSLLPAIHHVVVAKQCIAKRKHLVTTSYVSPAMQELDEAARKAGIILLNELGLDPGIDHMSAMQHIHAVQKHGGKVVGFSSYCGGLPAVRHNNNPFGYKFSWSPRGVVSAGKNNARFKRDGKIAEVPGETLFENYEFVDIKGLGTFEGYPNRNSIDYIAKYGLQDVTDMFRGTLRNVGHCETWRHIARLGLLDNEKQYDFTRVSPAGLIASLIGKSDTSNLGEEVARYLQLPAYGVLIKKLGWLGFFEEKTLPLEKGSAMDMLVHLLVEHLGYQENEADLVILQDELTVEYPDRKEKLISTLIDEGVPGGDTAMARTVSIPAAIGGRLILEGKIDLTGVRIPTDPMIYGPVLEELAENQIVLKETRIPLPR